MLKQIYNPDVLTCLANLSSDEVFTPPSVVNQMLDTLPKELWSDEKITFLDPVSKSGVFLREITKRLIDGLESKFPNLEERIEHILRNQVFGIGITELTSLISRRSLYCSKYANGKYSIVQFDDEQGNLKYFETGHVWEGGICKYCGVSKEIYDRGDELENYAFSFIHTDNPENFFNMKFDVIVGNPPYQLNTGGSGKQARPIYQKFIQTSKKLNPRYISMIIPSRWFGGGMGLNSFREEMLNDRRMEHLVDFLSSQDCFQGVDIAGGVCYFLWSRDYEGECQIVNKTQGKEYKSKRYLNEFKTFIRLSPSVNILKKVIKKDFKSITEIISSTRPFGLKTSDRPDNRGELTLVSSKVTGKIPISRVTNNKGLIKYWKVMTSKTSHDHAGQPDKEGKRKVLSRTEILRPNWVCTESYILLGCFDNKKECENLLVYSKTKFFRFLVSLLSFSQDITRDRFSYVPIQNFDEEWTNEKLYKKYGLNEGEIEFIESMIRPME